MEKEIIIPNIYGMPAKATITKKGKSFSVSVVMYNTVAKKYINEPVISAIRNALERLGITDPLRKRALTMVLLNPSKIASSFYGDLMISFKTNGMWPPLKMFASYMGIYKKCREVMMEYNTYERRRECERHVRDILEDMLRGKVDPWCYFSFNPFFELIEDKGMKIENILLWLGIVPLMVETARQTHSFLPLSPDLSPFVFAVLDDIAERYYPSPKARTRYTAIYSLPYELARIYEQLPEKLASMLEDRESIEIDGMKCYQWNGHIICKEDGFGIWIWIKANIVEAVFYDGSDPVPTTLLIEKLVKLFRLLDNDINDAKERVRSVLAG